MREIHRDIPLNIVVYDNSSVSINLSHEELTVLVELLGIEQHASRDAYEEPDSCFDNLEYRLAEALRFASYDADDPYWKDE